jgi:uncharacterized protein
MYPLAFSELAQANGVDAEKSQLAQRLVFGSYPDVLHAPGKEVEVLQNIVKHYLYKDLFRTEQLKKPVLLENIVRAIALQMGKEISFHEIGQVIRASPQTVEKYVDLLEKACIVFRLPSLSRNLRTEIKKGRRIYFYDNGFRNAILNSFAPLETRSDISVLWENYLVSERLKMLKYTGSTTPGYFWRTTDQQTVDYIEEPPGELNVFAFKWNPETPAKIHDIFTQNYKITNLMAVSRGNYDVFLKV